MPKVITPPEEKPVLTQIGELRQKVETLFRDSIVGQAVVAAKRKIDASARARAAQELAAGRAALEAEGKKHGLIVAAAERKAADLRGAWEAAMMAAHLARVARDSALWPVERRISEAQAALAACVPPILHELHDEIEDVVTMVHASWKDRRIVQKVVGLGPERVRVREIAPGVVSSTTEPDPRLPRVVVLNDVADRERTLEALWALQAEVAGLREDPRSEFPDEAASIRERLGAIRLKVQARGFETEEAVA